MCEITGGPFSGRGGAPPTGNHVSAACCCPTEEVCHINELKPGFMNVSEPRGDECYLVLPHPKSFSKTVNMSPLCKECFDTLINRIICFHFTETCAAFVE